jgi:hypothetical protein
MLSPGLWVWAWASTSGAAQASIPVIIAATVNLRMAELLVIGIGVVLLHRGLAGGIVLRRGPAMTARATAVPSAGTGAPATGGVQSTALSMARREIIAAVARLRARHASQAAGSASACR